MRTKCLSLIALAVSAVPVYAGGSGNAVIYRDRAYGYEVVFPGKPTKKTLSKGSPDRGMPIDRVMCGSENEGASVFVMPLPANAGQNLRQMAVGMLLKNMQAQPGEVLKRDETVQIGADVGQHVLLSKNEKWWSEAFIFLHGSRLFVLMTASTSVQGLQAACYRTFYGSFKFTGR